MGQTPLPALNGVEGTVHRAQPQRFSGAANIRAPGKTKATGFSPMVLNACYKLMNLPRHNRRFYRIVSRNRDSIVQRSARRYAHGSPTASAQERETCRTSAVNQRA